MSDTNEELFEAWIENCTTSEIVDGLKEEVREELRDQFHETRTYQDAFEQFVIDDMPQDMESYKLEAFGGE